MSNVAWTPAVRDALNLEVINSFGSGTISGTQRVSGLLDICGAKTSKSENIVVSILGKNFRLRKRGREVDTVTKRGVNIYEQRARLGNYVDFLSIDRMDVIYDKIERVMATAETAGMEVAEGPTRMIEAAVPLALSIPDHTGTSFFGVNKPIKPGSSVTFDNRADLGALDFTSYDEAERRLAQIPDEDERACNSRVRVLAVGQKYKQIGREIVENPRPKDYAGGDNLRTQDRAKLIVVPDWPDTFWMVADTDLENDMPFYCVQGRALQLKPLYTNPEGAWEIEHNELLWAVEGDLAIALGNPRRAFMSVDPADVAAIVADARQKFTMNDFDFDLA